MTQSLPSTTFGSILYWVYENLKQVEEEMASDPLQQDVSNARQSIENILVNDRKLDLEFRKLPEQQYEALVRILQNRDLEVTPEMADGAQEILDQLEASQVYSQDVIGLAKRAIDQVLGR